MKKIFVLIALLFAAPLAASFSSVEQPPPNSPSFSKCIRVTQSGPNGSSYSFYNGCGERLWINACLEGSFNRTQLIKSARDIPIGGRFTVYPNINSTVRKISWSAHPYSPIIPGICGKP